MITITIDTGNAAFEDDMKTSEIARILIKLADDIDNTYGALDCKLYDINGNAVGRVVEK